MLNFILMLFRYQTALKHNTSQAGTAKVDSIREELEDAELKVEQCRVNLLFLFL